MTDWIEWIGWASASLLVATITAQIRRQYREQSIRGVSPWLYVGQGLASSGLATYAVLTRSWVFVALNLCMTLGAATGLVMWLRLRKRQDPDPQVE